MDLFGILSDIDSLAFSSDSPFSFCCFNFIPRAANGLADGLAKAQRSTIVSLNLILSSLFNENYSVAQKKNQARPCFHQVSTALVA